MKKQIKKRFRGVFGLFLLAAVSGLLFVSTQSVSAASKKIVLKAVSYTPIERKGAVGDVIYGRFIDRINKLGKGEIEIQYLGSGEVIPANQQMEACKNGIVDLAYLPGAYYQSSIPFGAAIGASELTPWEERKVGFYDWNVEEHIKYGVHPLGRAEYFAKFHIFSNKKIERIADFKGLKFRSNGAYNPFFKKFGVVTVELPSNEIYTAMERGLVVGFAMPVFISDRWKFHEVTKYRINPGFWNSPTMYHINQKKFLSLPEHLQKLLLKTAEELERESTAVLEEYVGAEDKRQLAAGMKFIDMDPRDVKEYLDTTNGAKWEVLNKLLPKDTVEKLSKMIRK